MNPLMATKSLLVNAGFNNYKVDRSSDVPLFSCDLTLSRRVRVWDGRRYIAQQEQSWPISEFCSSYLPPISSFYVFVKYTSFKGREYTKCNHTQSTVG